VYALAWYARKKTVCGQQSGAQYLAAFFAAPFNHILTGFGAHAL